MEFPLMQLPAEVRCLIYHFILVNPTPLKLCSRGLVNKGQNSFARRFGILTINRQEHAEVIHILYSMNEFDFSTFRTLHLFLMKIGRINCQSLTRIIIRGDMDEHGQAAFQLLADATRIRSLKFATFHHLQYINTNNAFQYMKPWIVAISAMQDDPEAVLKIIKWQETPLTKGVQARLYPGYQHDKFLLGFTDSLMAAVLAARQTPDQGVH